MAENTLGRKIQDGAKTFRAFGEEIPLNAEVKVISGFSGHAYRDEILAFLAQMRSPPATTFVVHGEPDQADGLARHLAARGWKDIRVPGPGERFQI